MAVAEARGVMERAGQARRVVLEVRGGVGIFMSTTRGIHLIMDGYRRRRISLEVWRLMGRERLWMGMDDIRTVGLIGLLLGRGCKFQVY